MANIENTEENKLSEVVCNDVIEKYLKKWENSWKKITWRKKMISKHT